MTEKELYEYFKKNKSLDCNEISCNHCPLLQSWNILYNISKTKNEWFTKYDNIQKNLKKW